MRFEFQCPQCGHVTRLPASAEGTITRCLCCGARLLIPDADEPVDAEVLTAEVLAVDVTADVVDAEVVENPPSTASELGVDTVESTDSLDGLDDIDFTPVESPATEDESRESFASSSAIHGKNVSPNSELPGYAAQLHRHPGSPAFSMSPAEFRELTQSMSSTRRSVVLYFWILLAMMALQIVAVAVVASTLSDAQTPEAHGRAVGSLVGGIVVAMLYAFAAILLYDYAERLSVFRLTRSPRNLILATISGGNFWKWMSIATVTLLIIGIVAIAFVVFVTLTITKPVEPPPDSRWPPFVNPRPY